MMERLPPLASFDERLPAEELAIRHDRIRRLLSALLPEADGLLLFGDTNLYYASGTIPSGALWIPKDGDPVLFVRKGLERARSESPLRHILAYRSFGELCGLSRSAGSPLPQGGMVAADMGRISWALADLLQKKLPHLHFMAGDTVMKHARAVKTAWEIAKMRRAGALHERCLCRELPARIRPGMSEWDIAGTVRSLYRAHGDGGFAYLNAPGRVSVGGAAVGDSALYPTAFDGPMGMRGLHPSMPHSGSRERLWERNQLLTVDMPCCVEGYVSDKTVTFFSGGTLPDDVKAAAECCADIYERSREALRAGVLPSRVWALAQGIARKYGLEERFMGLGAERVRFLGHGLGLEMDEFPAIAAGFDEALEAGMVIALEPKIAVPGKGMAGMEDSFLVGDGPAESLSGPASSVVLLD